MAKDRGSGNWTTGCLLNRIHGRTYAEIAQAMQLSQSAVEKHMMRALDACKASLAGPAGEQARSAQP